MWIGSKKESLKIQRKRNLSVNPLLDCINFQLLLSQTPQNQFLKIAQLHGCQLSGQVWGKTMSLLDIIHLRLHHSELCFGHHVANDQMGWLPCICFTQVEFISGWRKALLVLAVPGPQSSIPMLWTGRHWCLHSLRGRSLLPQGLTIQRLMASQMRRPHETQEPKVNIGGWGIGKNYTWERQCVNWDHVTM